MVTPVPVAEASHAPHSDICFSPTPFPDCGGWQGGFRSGAVWCSWGVVRDGSEQEKLRCRTKPLQLVPTEGLGDALADLAMGAGWGAQPHGGFGSGTVPKVFCSKEMKRSCCGYSG